MVRKITLSLCMIVKNEEQTLKRCLDSVQTFIDEIIIVDTGSKDRTKEIAKEYNAKIYDFKWIDDFSAARNYSFNKATKEYIMWLDGDDYVNQDNINKVKKLLEKFDDKFDYVSVEYILGRAIDGQVSYSLRRNRIVKRNMGFKWIGKVHEYLNVYGKGYIADFQVEHGKIKKYTDRNLKIFSNMEKRGEEFSPRELFYYGNELKDNGFYDKAIELYRKFIDSKLGWIEDMKIAYAKIIECYNITKQQDKIPEILIESFEYDVPKAELCCNMGEYYLNRGLNKQSIFWYKAALDSIPHKDNPSINSKEYYTFIPSIQLCVAYYRLGYIKCAYFFNELASSFKIDLDKNEYNRRFFIEEFKKLNMEIPQVKYPIKASDYIDFL